MTTNNTPRWTDFDEVEFDLYAGAESFSDGTRPQVWNFVGTVTLDGKKHMLDVIISSTGISFMFMNDDTDVVTEFYYELDDNEEMCKLIVAGMLDETIGYKYFRTTMFEGLQFTKNFS